MAWSTRYMVYDKYNMWYRVHGIWYMAYEHKDATNHSFWNLKPTCLGPWNQNVGFSCLRSFLGPLQKCRSCYLTCVCGARSTSLLWGCMKYHARNMAEYEWMSLALSFVQRSGCSSLNFAWPLKVRAENLRGHIGRGYVVRSRSYGPLTTGP